LGDGSVWDIAFSKDPQQKYIFLADGSNEKIYVLLRDTLEILTSFGDGGRQPGQFYAVHSIAANSKGDLFTTETYRGQRVQKFVYKGMAPATKKDQGVVWPKSSRRAAQSSSFPEGGHHAKSCTELSGLRIRVGDCHSDTFAGATGKACSAPATRNRHGR